MNKLILVLDKKIPDPLNSIFSEILAFKNKSKRMMSHFRIIQSDLVQWSLLVHIVQGF